MQVIGWVPVEDPARERTRRREARARWWRRHAVRHRRLAAAVLLAVAAALAVQALRPAPTATTPVLVAAAALPAGHRLSAGDLTTAPMPPDVVPEAALGPGDLAVVTGEVLASPVGAGELVTASRTVGAGLLASAPPGTLAVPVALGTPMPDGAVRAGDRVAVLAGGAADPYAQGDELGGAAAGGATGGGQVLVAAATVLVAPQRSAQDDGLLPATGTGAGVALLALTTREAEAVAGAASTRALTLAVLPPGAAGAN